MALPKSPIARHDSVVSTFGGLVMGTSDWSAPAPVAGWTSRSVVDHLVDWFPGFLAAGGVDLAPGPSVAEDPCAAWQHQNHAVHTLLTKHGDDSFTHPYVGVHRLSDAVDRFYTADVFMHSWDLARATDQSLDLDEDYAADLLTGLRALEDVLRGSGQYGVAVAVSDDAGIVDQLMGFIGRDPSWTPSGA